MNNDEDKIAPIPKTDDDEYLIDELSKWSELSLANTTFHSPSGKTPVVIDGMRLVRLTNILFEHSYDAENTVSIMSGSLDFNRVV